jgi:predicted PP-loop superfamily ATPase
MKKILITPDGKGVTAKTIALEELLRRCQVRANQFLIEESLNQIDPPDKPIKIKKSFHDWLNEENEIKRAENKPPIVIAASGGLDHSSPINFAKDFRENLITKEEFYYKLSLCMTINITLNTPTDLIT